MPRVGGWEVLEIARDDDLRAYLDRRRMARSDVTATC
jgi:hypothetical protein